MAANRDPISSFRSQQHHLARSIAFDRLVPLVEVADRLAGRSLDPALDPTTAHALMLSNFCAVVDKALIGYTDWLAVAIVRGGTFVPVRLTMPDDAELKRIADEYDAPVPIVRFVIEQANREPYLPILGDITDGMLLPNSTTLSQWASHFDWSVSDPTETAPQ